MTQQQFIEEFNLLPDEARRQVADFMAFLRQRYRANLPAQSTCDLELKDEPFMGMWRNRRDLKDSSAWVRNLRRTEWGEFA